jgi:peptidoglycan/LPS O-acetylase OafA/YrhL
LLTYSIAAGTAATCGPDSDEYSCGLGASMGIGLIGFVFAVLATVAGFSTLLDDLRHAPRTHARYGAITGLAAAVLLAGLLTTGLCMTTQGTAALPMSLAGLHLVVLGTAWGLRDACVRRWRRADPRGSGREHGQDHPDQVVGDHGTAEHRPRR